MYLLVPLSVTRDASGVLYVFYRSQNYLTTRMQGNDYFWRKGTQRRKVEEAGELKFFHFNLA